MLTKQLYISITTRGLEYTAVIGTDKFEQYIRSYVLNPSLLSESELELFIGTLTVLDLLQYYTFTRDSDSIYIKYGIVDS